MPLLGQQGSIEESIIAQHIADALAQEGFQSIDINQVENGLVLAYENRVYRFDAVGLQKVLTITKEELKKLDTDFEQIIFLTKRHNIPEVSTTWHLQDSLSGSPFHQLSFSRNVSIHQKGKTLVTNKNTGNFRAELVLRPFLTMELGNLFVEDQFIHLFDLRPKLNIYLWKGAHFTYEFILPISNEFKELGAPQWSEIRPRVVSLTQQFQLPFSTYVNTSLGLFSRSRYGFSAQIGKYAWQDRLLLTGEMGYTGTASYVRYNGFEVKKSWAYSHLNYLDYKLGVRYWFPKWNTQVSVEYGKVLSDKKAFFVRCKQRFKEVELEFYAFHNGEGSNYGLELAIPIFPRKYWKPKLFSIRPTKQFRYNYLSGQRERGQLHLAREYQSQGMFGTFPQDLNPHFLKNYVLGN